MNLVLHCLNERVVGHLPQWVIRWFGGERIVKAWISNLYQSVQMPRLNKQFIFVMLDHFLSKYY